MQFLVLQSQQKVESNALMKTPKRATSHTIKLKNLAFLIDQECLGGVL
jgi:hypothetical protein